MVGELDYVLYLVFKDDTPALTELESGDDFWCPDELTIWQINKDATEVIETFQFMIDNESPTPSR